MAWEGLSPLEKQGLKICFRKGDQSWVGYKVTTVFFSHQSLFRLPHNAPSLHVTRSSCVVSSQPCAEVMSLTSARIIRPAAWRQSHGKSDNSAWWRPDFGCNDDGRISLRGHCPILGRMCGCDFYDYFHFDHDPVCWSGWMLVVNSVVKRLLNKGNVIVWPRFVHHERKCFSKEFFFKWRL